MLICANSRRRLASAVLASMPLCIASMSLASFDNDPVNDDMAGAEALETTIGGQTEYRAELVDSDARLDVDFFMIDANANDAVTITLVRAQTDEHQNSADLNLRLHAYTPGASLLSAPGVGANPTMTFLTDADGPIYIGVGLACDTDLDGVENASTEERTGGFQQVETVAGAYDIVITIDRQAPTPFLLEDPADCDEEVNAFCPPAQTFFPYPGAYIIGSLEKREYPDCEPDTFMVLFDKQLNIVNADDNSSKHGNGWASGLAGVAGGNGFIDNGNGTRSLRIGVTGRPDGLDGDFNGYFQNAPHHQIGEFTLTVTFINAGDGLAGEETYTNRFETGAEAFYINFDVPLDATFANININNTTGGIAALPDQDVFHLEGLVPFCDYFISQIGGLNCECMPTDTVMVWVDKNCNIIWDSNEYSPETGYDELQIIADYRGRANFAIAGEDQRGRLLWVGLDLYADDSIERAPGDCELPDPNIDYGCYTLCFRLAPPHEGAEGPMQSTDVVGGDSAAIQLMQESMLHGDINVDGKTDTADLGVLIGNFGWSSN